MTQFLPNELQTTTFCSSSMTAKGLTIVHGILFAISSRVYQNDLSPSQQEILLNLKIYLVIVPPSQSDLSTILAIFPVSRTLAQIRNIFNWVTPREVPKYHNRHHPVSENLHRQIIHPFEPSNIISGTSIMRNYKRMHGLVKYLLPSSFSPHHHWVIDQKIWISSSPNVQNY